jgi:hypothetical protein
MTLQQEILEILKTKDGLKARDFVILIQARFKHEVDKKDINHVLYSDLKDVVYQDSNYKWFLKNNLLVNQVAVTQVGSSLSKLSEYYLDCLSRDFDIEISTFATSKYGSPDYGQIYQLPITDLINDQEIFDLTDVKNTVSKVKQKNKELILQLGYPIHIRKHAANSGYYYFVEPLFLIPFDTTSFLNGGTPKLTNEAPQFNRAAVARLSGLSKGELLNEILLLSEELGFNNSSENLPSFDEIFLRLKKLRTSWNWKEEIDPDNLSIKSLKEITNQGIYNCAGLFCSQRSKYTIGLVKELSDFKTYDKNRYDGSALGEWLHG